MKYLLLFSLLFLAGCNSMDGADVASRAIDPLSTVMNYDTNGYYSKRTTPHQKVCEYRVSQHITKWQPCK